MIKKYIKPTIMFLLMLVANISYGQGDSLIKGRITTNSGSPVSDAVVSVLDEFTQVTTDVNGNFIISAAPGKTLYISKIGFVPQKHSLKDKEPVTIIVESESEEPSFQVAYGTRTRTNSTAALSLISADDLSKVPVSTLGNAIQGFASGLTILRSVGSEPGWDQPAIYIRGVQTFSDGRAPLVMVDNVQRDFAQLDPEEIESFTVLKDAAAVAMYGMRAANGVINITTKRGFIGKPIISLTAQLGMQSPTRLPNYVGSPEYVRYRNIALRNDYDILSDAEFNNMFLTDPRNTPENYDGRDPYLYANTNWYDDYLKKNALQQMYKLSFRGGSETAQYYLMLGVVDQQGLYNYANENPSYPTQNQFKRYNFRSTVDVNLNRLLKVGVNLGGRVENRHTPNASAERIISSLSMLPPTMPSRNKDNSIAGTSQYLNNPYGLIAKSGFADRFSRYLQGTTTADLKMDFITEGLKANLLFGFDASKFYGRSKNQSFAVYQQNLDGTYTKFMEDTSLDMNYNGWGYDDYFNLMLNFTAGFSYDRVFGKVNAIAADLRYMQSTLMVEGDNPDFRNQGIFGRMTYTFDKRYTAEFGYSYNGSENFAKGKQFGFFPVVSGAWVISNESFLNNDETVSFLKLRGSYGKLGNSNIGIGYRYPFEEKFYNGGGYLFGDKYSGSDGSYEGRIPNNNLTWEQSVNANIGIEAEIMKLLSIEVDFFNHNRTQIITGRWTTLPSLIGQELPYVNDGSVQSHGFEVTLKHTNRINEFVYYIQGNASLAKNKITRQDDVAGLYPWEYRTNQMVAQGWGLEVAQDQFFEDQADIDNWAKSSFGVVAPGDIKYVDQNNDKVIDVQDFVPVGNPTIPEWNFGLNLGFEYRGFDFNMLLSGIANRSLFITNNVFSGLQDNSNITAEVAENAWGISENPLYPRLTTALNLHNILASTMRMKNVDFLRIQTLEIGYSLPKSLLMGANIREVRFFINGYNLFSFDSLKKYNLSAEVPDAGVRLYPETRVVNIGATLKF